MSRSTILILLGVLLVVSGFLALVNPFAASLAVTSLVGAILVVSGAVQLWLALFGHDLPHRLWTGLLAVIALVAGVDLMANPLAGMISLTVLVGALFLITGLVRLWIAFALREAPHFWPILISAVASVLIGGMVLSNVLAAATSLLGLLLGFQLIADGVALVALGLSARNL
ncbi:MAG: DUF308 domain-containing protein [Paracoccaceae bacterium]